MAGSRRTTWALDDLIRYSRGGSWQARRLADIVSTHARVEAGRIAVIDSRTRITYAELERAADETALGMLDSGVRPGDVVSIKLPNWHEVAITLLAAERIGAIVNPIALTAGAHELGEMLAASQCRLLVAAGEYRGKDHAAEATELLRTRQSDCAVVAVGDSHAAGCLPWEAMRAGGDHGLGPGSAAQLFAQLASGASALAHLSFSSGSTGVPRGILHTHNSLLSTVADYIRLQGFGRNDVFHVPLPLGYSGGFVYGLRLALQAGGTAVLQERWNAAEMVDLVVGHRATYTTGTPTHVMDVVGLGKEGSLQTLRVYNCGGAHAPAHVVEAAIEALGTVCCRSYGMTECHRLATTTIATPLEILRHSDGKVQPTMSVRISDENGQRLPAGEEGLIEVRGPYLFARYLDPAAATAGVSDGYFSTGDTGLISRAGYITVTGRVKDIIVRGGAKIPSAAVEGVMVQHPDVETAALVPKPDQRLGEVAVACVVLKPGRHMGLEDMLQHLEAQGVTKQHWPSELHVFDELPKTPTGKVRKAELTASLSEAGGWDVGTHKRSQQLRG